MATSTLTLREKVEAVLSGDDTGEGPHGQANTRPVLGKKESLSTFELDLRDWGMVFGIAYGIACGEDPYEPRESAGARALAVAESVFRPSRPFVRDDALANAVLDCATA